MVSVPTRFGIERRGKLTRDGHRYGLLRETDASTLLAHATDPANKTWWSRWRGRLGLSSDECVAALAGAEAAEGGAPAKRKEDKVPQALGDAVKLVFRTFDGEVVHASGFEGETVMVRFFRNRSGSVQS